MLTASCKEAVWALYNLFLSFAVSVFMYDLYYIIKQRIKLHKGVKLKWIAKTSSMINIFYASQLYIDRVRLNHQTLKTL